MATVAVIGSGYWGKNLVRNFAELGALRVVCDADADVVEHVTRSLANVRSTTNIDDVLGDPEIDGVVIATPAVTHADLAAMALRAGKHAFVEKPLAITANEARDLDRLAGEHGRVLMVGHLLEYHPVVAAMQRFIAEGRLGKLYHLFSNRLNFGKIRREENILWSFAPHDISVFLLLTGELPSHVAANGAAFISQGIADVTTCVLTFPSGVYGEINVSWLHPYKEHRMGVIGSKGMLVFTDTDRANKLLFYPHEVDWRAGNIPVATRRDPEPLPYDEAEPLRLECQHFLECIENGHRPRTDGANGIRVLTVLEACQYSLDRGGIPVDLARVQGHYWSHPSAEVHPEASVGAGTKVWHHGQIGKGAVVGERCIIGHNCVVFGGAVVGNGVVLESNIDVWPLVTLEDDVFVGPSVVFTNDLTPRAFHKKGGTWVPTRVARGASIGANATIICGITIGEYAAVGAGSVVTKDVKPFELVVGSPARRVRWICKCNQWTPLGFTTLISVCHDCKRTYRYDPKADRVYLLSE